ncbi:MAG: fused MFS/spermidine synthase [Burkholderiales bacterium]
MILFASTITLSAFLLFLVQPIIAKQILPWFGGSAAVWTTCMVFFQLTLLAGYFYSDLLIRHASPRRQAIVHTALLLASLALLPIAPSEALKPVDASDPVGRILLLLALTIGLPYLMLSTTGPLVQAWFSRRYQGGQVYRLYALSNVASMLALVAYPPLIEPNATGRLQSWGWSAAYALFALMAIGAAWAGARRASAGQAGDPAPAATGADVSAATPTAAPGWRAQAAWLGLSALGSVLLLAITTHITQNVASIPFLWVLPLALYLITFIMCFDGDGWYKRRMVVPLAALLSLLMLLALSWRPRLDPLWPPAIERSLLPLSQAVPLFALGLFICCLFCHGELVARKPEPRHLTRFYLMVSLGGAVGGLLVGLVAPVTLSWYWELPAALVLVTLLAVLMARGPMRLVAAVALCAAVVAVHDYAGYVREDGVAIARNFYGTLRVKATAPDSDPNAVWRLLHGVITHGEQYRDPARRTMTTTYYGESSGVGRSILALRAAEPNRGQRVGLIGLGVGTLAAYGRAGDEYRIYELNPLVLDWARTHFSYLPDSKAKIETPLGDARLVLEKEAPQGLDLLAVDAFSSDSIPVHLLTREAAQVYRRHVRDDGAIAIHISNRYLDLKGVVRQMADALGWKAMLVLDDPPESSHLYRTDWVVITGNERLIRTLREQANAQELPAPAGRRPWTDDYNNLFEVLK